VTRTAIPPSRRPERTAGALAALAGLAAGCALPDAAERAESRPFAPEYLGVETRKMDGELVNFLVAMRGARNRDDVADYARCAAAQYSLIRGYGFARHLRTTVYRETGIWRADAVYTISPGLPDGLRSVDAEVTVADCAERGIPTV
jgi:hypothetical protein